MVAFRRVLETAMIGAQEAAGRSPALAPAYRVSRVVAAAPVRNQTLSAFPTQPSDALAAEGEDDSRPAV